MIHISSHGGHCCGVRHLFNFYGTTTREEIREKLGQTKQHSDQGMLVEVILTNSQCKLYPETVKNLQLEGFKLVSRFKNPNSSNICNVFHYNKHPRSLTSRLPFQIVEQE